MYTYRYMCVFKNQLMKWELIFAKSVFWYLLTLFLPRFGLLHIYECKLQKNSFKETFNQHHIGPNSEPIMGVSFIEGNIWISSTCITT